MHASEQKPTISAKVRTSASTAESQSRQGPKRTSRGGRVRVVTGCRDRSGGGLEQLRTAVAEDWSDSRPQRSKATEAAFKIAIV